MSPSCDAGPGLGARRCIALEIRSGLSLGMLADALAALSVSWPPPDVRASMEVGLVVGQAAKARMAAGGHLFDAQLLTTLATQAASFGAVDWICSPLPWSESQGLPDKPTLVLAPGARFRRVNGPELRHDAAALALLAELGAFETPWPAVFQATAPVSHSGLHLLVLESDGGSQPPDANALASRMTCAMVDANPMVDQVVAIAFDVDDQSPEDLAIGLERIRAVTGVLDATLAVTGGKKGRVSFRVELLTRPDAASAAVRACFEETTTIGLRWQLSHRVLLRRESRVVTGPDGTAGTIKTVLRPGAEHTTKAEADSLAASRLAMAGRRRLRASLESAPATTQTSEGSGNVG